MDKRKSGSAANRKLLNLTYAYAVYEVDDSIFIEALEDDEPYADVTVNLSSYGYSFTPESNQVVIKAYEMSPDFLDTVLHDLVEEVIEKINYGPFDAYGYLVRLKGDWRERAVSLESLYRNA